MTRVKVKPRGYWADSPRKSLAWVLDRVLARLDSREQIRDIKKHEARIAAAFRKALGRTSWNAWSRANLVLENGKLSPKRAEGETVEEAVAAWKIPDVDVRDLAGMMKSLGKDAGQAGWTHGLKTSPKRKPAQKKGGVVDVPGAGAVALDLPDEAFAEAVGETMTYVNGINATTADQLRNLMVHSMRKGGSYGGFATELRRNFPEFAGRRATTISVTEFRRVSSTATRLSYEEQGITGKAWNTVDDEACEICQGNEAEGPIGISKTFSSGDQNAPAHTNCFPAGTLVVAEEMLASTERRYSGEVCEIRTHGGRILTATKNHPVLTSRGWVAAGAVRKGDYVFSARSTERVIAKDPNHDQVEGLIENVARTLWGAGCVATRSVPVATEDFHGDGTDDEVCIVRANGNLLADVEATGTEQISEGVFRIGPAELLRFTGDSPAALLLERLVAAYCGSMSWSNYLSTLGLIVKSPGETVGGRGRAKIDTSSLEALHDCWAAASSNARDLVRRLALAVEPDKVVDVRIGPFHGHVYNLQTRAGFYLAGGLVVHNCRCNISGRMLGRS